MESGKRKGGSHMSLQTVSQVSKMYGVTPRMLRYYEQAGLIESLRVEDYAYRMYDEGSLTKLRQIIVLRKLRVPVRQIAGILASADAAEAVEIFRQNISQLDAEITALSTVKAILTRFVEEIREKADIRLHLLGDDMLVSALSFSDNKLKEGDFTVEELNRANQSLNKLTDKDVRIVFIPPSDVAAYRAEGLEPEGEAGAAIHRFVNDSGLAKIKPDVRHFGFNAPNPKDETGYHGYEMWVTIPDGFDVPAPLIKKRMEGGMYCAHMIPMGAFDEWALLDNWINKGNDKYEYRGGGSQDNMFDSLEECLNYVNHIDNNDWDDAGVQLDLLIPIRKK
jgi:DNA-binding transcriptional MerR regulator